MNFDMWKKCKVVMLSTNHKARIHTEPKGMMYQSIEAFIQASQAYKSYRLYILSDNKIEESDWYWNKLHNALFQSMDDNQYFENEFKVIATTDASLATLISDPIIGKAPIQFPQIPQSFIDHYIQQYNKGNIITEVMVEYVDNWYIHIPSGKYHDDEPVKMKGNLREGDYYLKVNPDNTINIKSLKDSWSREEIGEILLKYGNEYANHCLECLKTTPKAFDIKKWIESNL